MRATSHDIRDSWVSGSANTTVVVRRRTVLCACSFSEQIIILQVQELLFRLLDERIVPHEEPLHLTSLTGGLECLLTSLRDSRYHLVSVLRSLSFLVSG